MTTRTFTEQIAARIAERDRPHVRRTDIALYEEQRPTLTTGFERMYWVAALAGRLSTGEEVNLTRTGDTAARAYASLLEAIDEQNWSIQ